MSERLVGPYPSGDTLDHLDAAGDALEAAAAEAEDEWIEGAVEALRLDLATFQGFETDDDGGRAP